MAIHEVYPGHHAQNVKTAVGDLPVSAKVAGFNGRATPLVEGIAHRSEELLSDLYGDALFPLFVRFRRLHTALRVQADLLLHHFGGRRRRWRGCTWTGWGSARVGARPGPLPGAAPRLHGLLLLRLPRAGRPARGLAARGARVHRDDVRLRLHTTLEVARRALAARARDEGAEGCDGAAFWGGFWHVLASFWGSIGGRRLGGFPVVAAIFEVATAVRFVFSALGGGRRLKGADD